VRAPAHVGENLPCADAARERQRLPSVPRKRIAGRRFVRFAPPNTRRSAFSGSSPQKNFGLVNPFLRTLSRLRKRVDAGLAKAPATPKSKRRRATKTRNSSAFLPREQKIAQVRARPKVCSMRILPDTAGCLRGGGAARHLHTKLSGVTVIFFLL
jgi:hypothetical protein